MEHVGQHQNRANGAANVKQACQLPAAWLVPGVTIALNHHHEVTGLVGAIDQGNGDHGRVPPADC